MRALLVQAPGQPGEALGLKNLAHGGGAQMEFLSLEGLADFIDRMVLLAQINNEGTGARLLGLDPRAGVSGEEEGGLGVVAEVVAEDAEGTWGIAESAGDVLGWAGLDEVGAEGFVLALLGQGGWRKKRRGSVILNCLLNRILVIVTYTRYGVKREVEPPRLVGSRAVQR